MTVVFVSSLVGFPPFYLVSVAAGALEMAFGPFLALGSVGRLLHFGVIAWLPHVVRLGL
jgi:membrane protein YqaA with SNARE-associated domain